MSGTLEEALEEEQVTDNWADDIWERPAPDPVRLARYRRHDPEEPSHYVRHTAHLPEIGVEGEETGVFWMRLLRRASRRR